VRWCWGRSATVGDSSSAGHAIFRDTAPDALTTAIERLTTTGLAAKEAGDVDRLRGHEGDAARAYFGVFRHLVTIDGRDFTLDARERRPPRGRMNALLSFLYFLLTEEAVAAVEAAGLDPQVGFLHALRSGKPSLALDLMEELRSPLADRIALRLVNLRELSADNFTLKDNGAVYLDTEGRRIVLRAWAERRQELVAHPAVAEKIPWGLVIHTQAKLLARHLRGEGPEYTAFPAPS
jgi:CRISPR-associated protein Cas1